MSFQLPGESWSGTFFRVLEEAAPKPVHDGFILSRMLISDQTIPYWLGVIGGYYFGWYGAGIGAVIGFAAIKKRNVSVYDTVSFPVYFWKHGVRNEPIMTPGGGFFRLRAHIPT